MAQKRNNPSQPTAKVSPTTSAPKPSKKESTGYQEILYTQRNAYIVLGIMAVTCFIAFFPGLFNEFTWDARKYIMENQYFPKLLKEGSAWFKDTKYGVFSAFELGNYHPITTLSWGLEYMLVGKSTWLYHLDQTLLHILNSWLVFRLIYQLHPKFLVAAITGILFAIHPLHVESVVWAAERKDTLYMLFMLLSFQYYIKRWQEGNTSQKKYWLAVLMFFLACFSKAMAVVLPVVFLMTDVLFFERKINIKLIIEKWPFWLIAIGTGLLSIYVQKDAGADATSQINSQYTIFERYLIITFNFSFYWVKMFIPTGLRAFYSYPNKPFPNEFYAAIFSTPLIVGIIYWLGRNNHKIWWGGFYFFVVILPVIQILPIGSAIVADRYFYASSLGPLYLLGLLGNNLYEKRENLRKSLPLVAGAIVVLFTLMSLQRSRVWVNDLSVFTEVFEAHPTNGFIAGNMGWSYSQKKDTLNTIKYFEKSGELGWHTDEIHIALANIYFAQKDYANAAKNFNKALELKPKNTNIYWNLGTCYYYTGDNQKAIEWCQKAVEVDKKNFFAHNILGLTYTKMGQYEKSVEEYQAASKYNPKFYDPYVNLSHTYNLMNRFDLELPVLLKAIKMDPKAPLAYKNIGVAYRQQGDWVKATEYWIEASKRIPSDGTFDYNVGTEYGNHGYTDVAVKWMRSAAKKGDKLAVDVLTSKGIPLQ